MIKKLDINIAKKFFWLSYYLANIFKKVYFMIVIFAYHYSFHLILFFFHFLDQILVLLEHGIELKSIENDLGKSLLRMAISENDPLDEESLERKIQTLLTQGATFHPTPPNEDSELILALKRRFFRIANYFIANEADVKHVGENGNTVLHLICKGL